MRLRFFLVIKLSLFCLVAVANAQQPSVEVLELRASGEDYLRAIRYLRIETDVAYFDPTQPAPPLETSETPRAQDASEDEARSGTNASVGRFFTTLISLVILVGVVYLAVRLGGAGTVSFGQAPENATRRKKGGALGASQGANVPANLQAIAQMQDRRAALVALSQYILARLMSAQGVLLQRSWTARDTLRRIPRDLDHRAALQALVLASERVQFGGRDVTEEEFCNHLERMRPLYSDGNL